MSDIQRISFTWRCAAAAATTLCLWMGAWPAAAQAPSHPAVNAQLLVGARQADLALVERSLAQGLKRKLVGLQMIERGIPRQGYPIAKDGVEVGFVTTGSFSPTLEINIGLGYVPVELAEVGTEVDVVIRGKALKAQVAPVPFYQPRYKR